MEFKYWKICLRFFLSFRWGFFCRIYGVLVVLVIGSKIFFFNCNLLRILVLIFLVVLWRRIVFFFKDNGWGRIMICVCLCVCYSFLFVRLIMDMER